MNRPGCTTNVGGTLLRETAKRLRRSYTEVFMRKSDFVLALGVAGEAYAEFSEDFLVDFAKHDC